MNIHRFKQCLLSKLISFVQNFMKLGHIVNSTKMSSPSLIMVTPCFRELLSFVHENTPFMMVIGLYKSSNFDRNCMKLVHIVQIP